MSEDEEKLLEPIFTEGLQKCASVVYNMGVLKHFASWGFGTFWAQDL